MLFLCVNHTAVEMKRYMVYQVLQIKPQIGQHVGLDYPESGPSQKYISQTEAKIMTVYTSLQKKTKVMNFYQRPTLLIHYCVLISRALQKILSRTVFDFFLKIELYSF